MLASGWLPAKDGPFRVRAREIDFGIDAAAQGSFDESYANGPARGQRSQLLQSLDALQRMRRQRHPLGERLAGVGVHADVLPDAILEKPGVLGVLWFAQER